MIVLLPVGIPGCGKTYYWYKRISKIESAVRIDEEQIFKTIVSSNENLYIEYVISIFKGHIARETPIIYWDGNLLSPLYRNIIISLAKKAKYKVIGIVFDTPLAKCIIRCNERKSNSHDRNTLEKMYETFRKNEPEYDEGFDDILIIKE